MKNNSGITIITLIITIIVIVMIASITIYSGLDTVDSLRTKEAKDTTNAIYLAIIANENTLPSGSGDGKMLSDFDIISNRTLSDKDFELLGLDYTSEDCNVTFDKYPSGDDLIVYNFTYKSANKKTYNNLIYTMYKETSKTNKTAEFDIKTGVNRPILSSDNMQPVGYDNSLVKNVYTESWYNYQKEISHFARMVYGTKEYVWIPRFAYKIQDFYLGKSYSNIPDTAVDIVFLRENTDYMSNNEVLPNDYFVHPAFADGTNGFWMSLNSTSTSKSISNAASSAILSDSGETFGHLMKNSEYAAAVLLSKYLKNNEIIFNGAEFVAAVCDDNIEGFDCYSTSEDATNYIGNTKGEALTDTPWNLKLEPVLPDASYKYIIRDVANGGVFYYRATGGMEMALYRITIPE